MRLIYIFIYFMFGFPPRIRTATKSFGDSYATVTLMGNKRYSPSDSNGTV